MSTATRPPVPDPTPWRELWQTSQTPWDQAGPHPELPRLLKHAQLEGGLKPGEAIYSGGVGRAHNEAALARAGYHVKAVDFVPEAIAAAQEIYREVVGLELLSADAFHVTAEEEGRFAAIFDRAMLCALQPEARTSYLQASLARLQAGGLWMGILFRSVSRPDGPPFAIDESTASSLFTQDFDLCFAGACSPRPGMNPGTEEWLCVWRRRAS